MQRLILFDIDETMISSDGAGRRAIGKALASRFDVKPGSIKLSMSGRTDPQILTEILRAAGLSDQEIEKRMDEVLQIYLGLLQAEIDNSQSYIIHHGVREILEALNSHGQTHLGLLTGNVEQGARMKLNRFDLNGYFPIGAYGSDSADRMLLPEIGLKRGQAYYNINFRPEQVVIIGDSIYDVLCAKGFGARSIAVNTGVTARAALEKQEPDYLFSSLADTSAVLKAILD
ncbi:MAG: HAD hydrolase-like protein [Candidatus Obscuribacterales bacterium]|nr:HAD hydrolase-like protein [Candidatus Obscuribacterales bacterium]